MVLKTIRQAALFVVICSLAVAAYAAQSKIDVTGAWAFDVQTDAGTGSPTMTFKQDGEKLTGHYVGTFGEADLTGSVKGNAITFSFSADFQGMSLTSTYKG